MICLDNFFTGSKDNVKHLIGRPNFELMRCVYCGAAVLKRPICSVAMLSLLPNTQERHTCSMKPAQHMTAACPATSIMMSCI